MAVGVINVKQMCINKSKLGFVRQKFNVVLPAAGVLVELSAGEALVPTSSPQNFPGFLSTTDLDPSEV